MPKVEYLNKEEDTIKVCGPTARKVVGISVWGDWVDIERYYGKRNLGHPRHFSSCTEIRKYSKPSRASMDRLMVIISRQANKGKVEINMRVYPSLGVVCTAKLVE